MKLKRILTMALALVCLLVLLPARAEETSALHRIVLRAAEGERTLGTGVLFGTKKALVAPAACWAEGELTAVGEACEHAVTYRGEIMGSQLILLGLAADCAAEPLLVTASEQLLSNAMYGADAVGMTTRQASLSRVTVIDGRAEVLLSAGEGLLPGAVMLGADGGIACLTLWQHGEGEGVYAALGNVTLEALLGGPLESEGLIHGFTAEVRDGQLILDWTDADGYDITENTVFTAYVTATCNPYLTLNRVRDGSTSISFPAIPGTEMMAWVAVSEGELAEHIYPEGAADAVYVTVPANDAFTGHGLRNIRCGVTPGEPGKDGWTEGFLPQQPLTREALADRTTPIYFQTEDAYEVARTEEEHSLMLALYTPEGYVFPYTSGYIFMPEMNGSDLWVSDVSVIFEDYEQFVPEGERWPAGEYLFVYYIDGGVVATIPFTLE